MGMGMFSLMSNGCDGAKKEETAGTRPVNLDAWSRYYLGWEMPNAAKADSQAKSLDIYCQNYTKASGPIKVNGPASLPYQYYLMEVRDATDTGAWDAALQTFMGTAGTNGVLMLHVDETIGAGSLEEDNDFNQHGVSEESKDKVLHPHQGAMPVYPYADSRLKGDDLGKQESLWYAGNNLAKAKGISPSSAVGFLKSFFFSNHDAAKGDTETGTDSALSTMTVAGRDAGCRHSSLS